MLRPAGGVLGRIGTARGMMMARVHVTLAALLAFGVSAAGFGPAGLAQTAPADPKAAAQPAKKAATPKKKAAADDSKADQGAALKQLDTAQKALDAGKPELAVNQANAVMSLPGIDARAMARALVIRGMAFKKQGKPAQAMADLQSALYIKNGLNDAERTAASQARSEAYREAGLPEPQAIGAPRQTTAPATPRVQTAATPQPEAPKPPPAASGGNFFTNLFGGGAPPAAPPAPAAQQPSTPPATTASVAPPAPTPPPATAKTAPVRASAAQVAPAPETPKPAVAATKAAVSGRFRMQLGPVRTQAEAKTVAERVRKEHAAALAGRSLTIDETVFGNMGTFYVVVVGPYAEAAEPKELCATLRGAKVADCQVLAP